MAEATARPSGASKLIWRVILLLSALAVVALTFQITFLWMDIAHLFPQPGVAVLVSGIVGTPPLILIAVAAGITKDAWL